MFRLSIDKLTKLVKGNDFYNQLKNTHFLKILQKPELSFFNALSLQKER